MLLCSNGNIDKTPAILDTIEKDKHDIFYIFFLLIIILEQRTVFCN